MDHHHWLGWLLRQQVTASLAKRAGIKVEVFAAIAEEVGLLQYLILVAVAELFYGLDQECCSRLLLQA